MKELTEGQLKATGKALRSLLSSRGISVKSAATRKMWAYTLLGHPRFESLVAQARAEGYIEVRPNPERTCQLPRPKGRSL